MLLLVTNYRLNRMRTRGCTFGGAYVSCIEKIGLPLVELTHLVFTSMSGELPYAIQVFVVMFMWCLSSALFVCWHHKIYYAILELLKCIKAINSTCRFYIMYIIYGTICFDNTGMCWTCVQKKDKIKRGRNVQKQFLEYRYYRLKQWNQSQMAFTTVNE